MSLSEHREAIFEWNGLAAEASERYEALNSGTLYLAFLALDPNTRPFAHLERTYPDDKYSGICKVFWKKEDCERYLTDVAIVSGYKLDLLRVMPVKLNTVVEILKKSDKKHRNESYRGIRADLCTVISGKIKAVEIFWTSENDAIM